MQDSILLEKSLKFYVALCTAAVTDDSTGFTIIEPIDRAYTRILVDSWTIISPPYADPKTFGFVVSAKNTYKIEFPKATDNWDRITHITILDALVGGNVIAYTKVIHPPKPLIAGDFATVNANTFKIPIELLLKIE